MLTLKTLLIICPLVFLAGFVDAIAGGVERVHILDGRIPHSILIELLSDRGIGTMLKKED